MCMSSSSDSAAAARAQQQQQQAAIDAATKQINTAFAGFNPAWFQNYQTAQEQYGLGQLAPQLQQTQNQLGFKLARQGLSDSTAGQQAGQSLQTEAGTQKQNVINQATGATNQLKQNVAQQQQQLTSEAEVANDPASVGNEAIGAASQFSAPSPMGPIGQMFSNWSNAWLGANNNATFSASPGASFLTPNSGTSYGGYGSAFNQPTTVVSGS